MSRPVVLPSTRAVARSFLLPTLVLLLTHLLGPRLVAAAVQLQHKPSDLAAKDIVVAMPTSSERLVLAQASRSYREGMRAYIMTDNAAELPFLNKAYGQDNLETYEHFPDEDKATKSVWHARNAGDVRAAVVPFFAHQHYGPTYKWLLYGDDDTVWFMDNVRRLLAGLDHEQPMMLTDNIWHNNGHPRLEATRCLPCGHDNSSLAKQQLETGYAPQPACPYCTPQAACGATRPDCKGPGAHGGAGVIISVGFFKHADHAEFMACINSTFLCSGGDCLFSRCAWRAGVGFTDPGHSLKFTKPVDHVIFDNMALRASLKDPITALVLGQCKSTCMLAVRHAVTFHLRGRSYTSFSKAAAAVYALVASHKAALEFLALAADTAGRNEPSRAAVEQQEAAERLDL